MGNDESLQPGDVVRIKPGTPLDESFSSAYGYGPFIVDHIAYNLVDGASNYSSWYLLNWDGSEQFLPSGNIKWHSRTSILQRDEFLTAARKANYAAKV